MIQQVEISRYWFYLLALFLSSTTSVDSLQAQDAKSGRPNMLVILVDDLGYGDLSSYGAKDLQSPYIDALVKRDAV